MSRFLTLTIARVAVPRFQLKRRAIDFSSFTSIRFKIILIGVTLVIGLFYLIQINSLSTEGFKIRELGKRVSQLKALNQELELRAAEIQSSQNLQSRINQLNMVALGKVDYLSASNQMVALAK